MGCMTVLIGEMGSGSASGGGAGSTAAAAASASAATAQFDNLESIIDMNDGSYKLGDMGTGQGQAAYLLGLLNTDLIRYFFQHRGF